MLTAEDFFTHWVRKEAILKATGDGLLREMTDVMVTPPHSPPSLLSVVNGRTPPCSMVAIEVDGYMGAVAVLSSHRIKFTIIDGSSLLRA